MSRHRPRLDRPALMAGTIYRHDCLPRVRIFVNISATVYSLKYFHAKVLATIEAWPVDILADYARVVELLIEHGPHLGLPHSRALGGGLFELWPRGRSGIGRTLYGFLAGQRVIVLHAFIKKTQIDAGPGSQEGPGSHERGNTK